ncbi:MAG: hypothetical protein DWI30_02260, partial [Chloroflexi bacterium]
MQRQHRQFMSAILLVMVLLLSHTASWAANPPANNTQKIQPKAACAPSITTVGNVRVYQFTITTTCDWTPPSTVNKIDMLLVGGGGGGGWGGGGGGGG